jgi:hypothetical protein
VKLAAQFNKLITCRGVEDRRFTKRLTTSDEQARPAPAEDGQPEIGQGRRQGDDTSAAIARIAEGAQGYLPAGGAIVGHGAAAFCGCVAE